MAVKRSNQAPLLSAFISHAKADAKKAQAIADGLESRGFKCWIAPRDARAGRSYGDEIIRGIEGAKAFVLVLSKASNDSAFVAREVERATSKKKPIFAIRVANVEPSPALELFISGTQWIDAFSGRLGAHIDRLTNLLAEEEGRNVPEPGDTRPAPRNLPKWAVPLGAAASVFLVLGAGLALWSRREQPSDPSLLTKPLYLPNPETKPQEQMAALESPRDTKVYAKTPASGADVARPESDLSVADPDFRACEKSSGVPAIAACDRAIASGKFTGRNLSYLYSDRGFMRMQKGAIVAALVDLNEAIEIDSTNFYAFWNRGAIYAAQRDFDSARVDFTTALAQRHPRSQCQALARSLGALGLLTGS